MISANGGHGIAVGVAGTDDTLIRGNYIGADVTGSIAFGNALDGIAVSEWNYGGPSQGSPLRATIRDNVVAGNGWYGVEIYGVGSNDHLVVGNRIGTNAAGITALGNLLGGVRIGGTASNNTISGASVADRNIISGNSGNGISVDGSGTSDNVVQGNYIGTDVTGTIILANTGDGILFDGGAHDNTIGGTAAGAGNVISGNAGDGIQITGSGTTGNVVEGNYIGTASIAPLTGTVSSYSGEANAADSTGTNNGTLNGGTTIVPGVSGQAFNFDGTGYVQIPNSDSLNVSQVTMAGWIKPVFAGRPAVPSDFDVVFSKGSGTGDGYSLNVVMDPTATTYYQVPPGGVPKGTVTFFAHISSGRQQLFSPTPLPDDGQYHHVAGTFDGVTMRLYIDGVEVASRAASGTIVNASNDAFIGGQPLNPAPHNILSHASIDEVILANRAYTAAEVKALAGQTALPNAGDGVHLDGGEAGTRSAALRSGHATSFRPTQSTACESPIPARRTTSLPATSSAPMSAAIWILAILAMASALKPGQPITPWAARPRVLAMSSAAMIPMALRSPARKRPAWLSREITLARMPLVQQP